MPGACRDFGDVDGGVGSTYSDVRWVLPSDDGSFPNQLHSRPLRRCTCGTLLAFWPAPGHPTCFCWARLQARLLRERRRLTRGLVHALPVDLLRRIDLLSCYLHGGICSWQQAPSLGFHGRLGLRSPALSHAYHHPSAMGYVVGKVVVSVRVSASMHLCRPWPALLPFYSTWHGPSRSMPALPCASSLYPMSARQQCPPKGLAPPAVCPPTVCL